MHAPDCSKPETVRLLFLHKIGEPPGDAKHQIGYDHDVVDICPACDGATLEHLRHDCFDFEEVWDQYEWYELSPEDGPRLRAVAARCERPLDPFCTCPVHRSLLSSAQQLPSSSWSVVFEGGAHRHRITLTDGQKPAFVLVHSGVEAPASPAAVPPQAKQPDAEAVLFVFVAWPVAFVVSLIAWFRLVDAAWIFDAVAVLVAFPLSFLVSAAVMMTGSRYLSRRRRGGDDPPRSQPS